MTGERLSAIELIRLYAPYFMNPEEADMEIKGKPIFSGHVREGRQVFFPYHWIIRKDGSRERLLFDNETGWQSGNWDVNCRSIAIVFDGDYENSKPSGKELESAATLIREEYGFVRKENIVGHGEINPKTTCPSSIFLKNNGKSGWKEDLLSAI
jgi:hypothetical protein